MSKGGHCATTPRIPDHAVGNVSSPTGMAYAGAGGTLGPGMTWAFVAGKHIAQLEPASLDAALEAV